MEYAEFGLPVKSFVTFDDFAETKQMTKHNRSLAAYYERFIYENGTISYRHRVDRIRNCGNSYVSDYYPKQKARYIKSAFYCHDKFCPFCQKGLSQARQQKYAPLLAELGKQYTLCHLTVTVEDPGRLDFPKTVHRMYTKFKYFTRILSGNKKIAGVDFLQYGYAGVLRATEVTTKPDTTLHPHFHCILALKKGITFPGSHINQFSFKRDDPEVYAHSDFEILLQKVWYLVYNGIKVTKESIAELKQGYSCRCIPFEDNKFHEVFKYCLKGLVKGDEFNLEYEDFEAIEIGLCGRHPLQGYGCFWQIRDSSKDTFLAVESDCVQKVQEVLTYLRETEVPIHECVNLDKVMSQMKTKGVLCFSKFNIHKVLVQMVLERRREEQLCEEKKNE